MPQLLNRAHCSLKWKAAMHLAPNTVLHICKWLLGHTSLAWSLCCSDSAPSEIIQDVEMEGELRTGKGYSTILVLLFQESERGSICLRLSLICQ